MNDKTMGQRIAQCRRAQNLSQEALGDQMGVSRQAISKWEADAAVPSRLREKRKHFPLIPL